MQGQFFALVPTFRDSYCDAPMRTAFVFHNAEMQESVAVY